jgi:hypothetical protein
MGVATGVTFAGVAMGVLVGVTFAGNGGQKGMKTVAFGVDSSGVASSGSLNPSGSEAAVVGVPSNGSLNPSGAEAAVDPEIHGPAAPAREPSGSTALGKIGDGRTGKATSKTATLRRESAQKSFGLTKASSSLNVRALRGVCGGVSVISPPAVVALEDAPSLLRFLRFSGDWKRAFLRSSPSLPDTAIFLLGGK